MNESSLEMTLAKMKDTLSIHEGTVTSLLERIEPLCRPKDAPPPAEDQPFENQPPMPSKPVSPIGVELEVVAARLQRLTAQVGDTLDRGDF
jgi:hypothetical protein